MKVLSDIAAFIRKNTNGFPGARMNGPGDRKACLPIGRGLRGGPPVPNGYVRAGNAARRRREGGF